MATWAFVAHDDSTIFYDGPWTAVPSSHFDFDMSNNTAHVLPANTVNPTTTPATLTFNFTGREIGVYGVASIFNSTPPAEADMPVWACAVDGNLLTNNNPYGKYPLESYCEASNLQGDVTHIFELSVSQSGSGFWIDFIRYLVSDFATVSPNTTAWIAPADPRLAGSGWEPLGDGFMTVDEQPISDVPVLSVAFTGSSLTWYGMSKAAMALSNPTLPALTMNSTISSEGFYTIDDASQGHDFSANVAEDVAHAAENPYNVILFTTPEMDVGTHTLNVYYNVNSTVWPLTLDSLTIANAFSTASFASSSVATSNHKSKAVVIGAAVGGVLGGLVVILLVLFARRQWMVRRREQRRRKMVTGIERNDIKLRPFSRLEDEPTSDPTGRIEGLPEH